MNIWEIKNELGFNTKEGVVKGVFCTGMFFGISDYGVGLLTVTILQGRLFITTIDDGIWVAKMTNTINPKKLAADITSKFGNVLPSEDDLNTFLRPYGMYGINEG